MMGAISAFGVALIGVFLSFLLSAMGYRGARLVSVSAALILLVVAAGGVGDLVAELEWISEAAGIGDIVAVALKIVGIGYVAGICYDVSLDMGERGVASAVLTVGRVEILLVIAPTLTDMLKLAIDML